MQLLHRYCNLMLNAPQLKQVKQSPLFLNIVFHDPEYVGWLLNLQKVHLFLLLSQGLLLTLLLNKACEAKDFTDGSLSLCLYCSQNETQNNLLINVPYLWYLLKRNSKVYQDSTYYISIFRWGLNEDLQVAEHLMKKSINSRIFPFLHMFLTLISILL